ncbi:MAG: hypothetical protein ACI4OL_02950, partial [Gemmiger sp.]
MLAAALIVSAALCTVFALLPARLCRRAPRRRDALTGVGSYLAVWIWSACVYAKPGLSVGFDAFRLAAVCGSALWASACVCGLRLARRGRAPGRPGALAVSALLLGCALGVEVFVCNLQYFATHNYQPVQLLDYLTADSQVIRNEDGSVTLDDEHTLLRFSGMDQPLYNLQLEGLTFQYDRKYPEYQNPLFTFSVSAADSSSVYERQSWVWDVALKAPRSYTRTLDLAGDVSTLTLRAQAYDGEYTWYSFHYTIAGITANAPRTFDFSLVRLAALFALFCAAWALRPGSVLWRESYLAHRRKYRPAVLLCAGALGILAVAAPFASPADSGVATSTYNVNNWDGESRISFTRHITDWQHDAFAAQYGSLAHSLLNGRLDLELDPPEALTEMDNPYDTGLRAEQAPDALWDVAYYNGRYY